MKFWANKEKIGAGFDNWTWLFAHDVLFTATHAFFVWLNVEEYVESEQEQKILFSRAVRDARYVPMDEVCAMYDNASAMAPSSVRDGSILAYEALMKSFGQYHGLLRIAIIDDNLPDRRIPTIYILPVTVTIDEESFITMKDQMPSDVDWLKCLKASTAAIENAWKAPIRLAALNSWAEKQRSHRTTAGMHALNLRQEPGRMGQHVHTESPEHY